jgi:hypothetical protein
MSIVDDRGRVGGRFNLIDGLVALVILVLIPVAYGSYLLFRTPQARLTSIEPTRVYQGKNLRIIVNGVNLRPFMRVAFNTIQGRSFLLGSTTYASIELPDLEPGVYDVQLFDYMQQVSELPKAFTVLPLAPVPTVVLEVEGSFTGLPPEIAGLIAKGFKFAETAGSTGGEVVSVGPPRPARLRLQAGDNNTLDLPIPGTSELPARLRVKCYVASNPDGTLHCMMSGPQQASVIAPDSVLTLAGPRGWVSFQIDWVYPPAETPAQPPQR